MGTLVETDIDHFIRERKNRLQDERKTLADKDRYSTPDQPKRASPAGRKQWDRGGGRDARPAEQKRPPSARETGLALTGDQIQQQKKQMLMNQRQQEYNDILSRAPQKQKRRPKTPAGASLPLGSSYEQKKKVLERERNEDMKKELAKSPTPPKPTAVKVEVFDYNEAKKAHLEEKRKEYNEYLAEQANRKGRHIITPEQGMFIGPDQAERTQQERQKNIENRRDLEKQREKLLLLRAREAGQIPYASPRQNLPPQYPRNEPAINRHPERNVPPLELEDRDSPEPVIVERLQDMPNISPGRDEKYTGPLPVYKPRHTQRRHFHDNYIQRQEIPEPSRDGTVKKQIEPVVDEREDNNAANIPVDPRDREGRHLERGPKHSKGDRNLRLSKDDSFIKDAKEKYQWYNERHLSPPVQVRRSRSLSPPRPLEELHKEIEQKRRQLELEQQPQPPATAQTKTVSEESQTKDTAANQKLHDNNEQLQKLQAEKERLRRIYETQKEQLLQDEYRRRVEEEQQVVGDRARTDRGPEPDYEKQRQLGDERKREYQDYLAKKPPKLLLRRKEITPEYMRRGLPLDQARHDEKRKILLTERKQEYNEILSKQPAPREKLPTPDEIGLKVGEGEQERIQQLYEQRKHEYNEMLAQQHPKERRGPAEGTGATLPVGEYEDVKRQKLSEERHNEYLQLQQQKLASERQRGLPPRQPTPNHFFKQMGEHDRKAQVLNEERKKEYNQRLAQNRVRTRGEAGPSAEDNVASIPIKGHESAELQKVKQRNEEYKAFLEEKKLRDQHRLDHKKPPTAPTQDGYATLPGLKYSDSAEMRKVKERNKEYNEYLQKKGPPGPRRGWQTPTYEEILEQKRREETQRRQVDDADYEPSRLRGYASDGALNRLQDEFRGRDLDKEFEARKVRFEESRNYGGILDDPNWLNPERREQEYQTLQPSQAEPEQVERPVVQEREDMAARVDRAPYLGGLPIGEAKGLPVGSDERESAKQRKKAEYRQELQLQIEEEAARRKREKIQDLRTNASGFMDPEKSSNRLKGLGGAPTVSPRKVYKGNEVQKYHLNFLEDDSEEHDAVGRPVRGQAFSSGSKPYGQYKIEPLGRFNVGGLPSPDYEPSSAQAGYREDNILRPQGILTNARNTPFSAGFDSLNGPSGDNLRLDLGDGGGFGQERGRRRDRDVNILDSGFTGLLNSRRPTGGVNLPAGLMYTPSSYLTGGGGLGGSMDEVYNYYGMRDILQGDAGGGGGLALNVAGSEFGGPGLHGPQSPRVTFAAEPQISYRKRDRSRDRISPYQFDDPDQRSRSRNETLSYQQELERQIAEKRYKKQLEKEEQDRYEKKLEEDIKNFNPFGKSGAGAPMRDASGQAIADLRLLQRGIVEPSPRRASPVYSSPRVPSPRDDKIPPPPPQQNAIGENIYARGGHGIFGNPKTDTEKAFSDKYKDELRQQIADKRRREQMEKEKERMEEEKENRRLEDQRIRMQSEYDEEQKKIKAREEETRRKNEELKRQAEERKKEQERQRMEADEARMREQQAQIDRERQERQQQQQQEQEPDRLKSPPVPAVRAKQEQGTSTTRLNSRSNSRSNSRPVSRKNSPPIPALRRKPVVLPEYNYYFHQSDDTRTKSPPLPAHRAGRESPARTPQGQTPRGRRTPQVQTPQPGVQPGVERANSSDVLLQLSNMRKQLNDERRKVELALVHQKNDPDVFDPRIIQRPGPQVHVIGAFDKAVNKNASLPPPRAPSSDLANARNLQQFSELKNKSNTESRKAFRGQYPDAPITNNTLEAQQSALLQQQEATLRAIREGWLRPNSAPMRRRFKSDSTDPFEEAGPSQNSIGRQGNASARSHLPASSAFIDVDEVNPFPDDFDELPRRNDNARSRRRDRFPSPRPDMGSQASLDVDTIQRKNEERLRRLQNMNTGGDDLSIGNADEILENFMAKQRHNRPPTGNTLTDDTWMRAGSRP